MEDHSKVLRAGNPCRDGLCIWKEEKEGIEEVKNKEASIEMIESSCEPDEVDFGKMICDFARWNHHDDMFSFYHAAREQGRVPSLTVHNFMISSLHKASMYDVAT